MLEIIPASNLPLAIAQERSELGFRPTASVLARNENGLYLFVEQKREESEGIFWPIQGGISSNEQPLVGAAREAMEETGLRLCPDRLTSLDGMRYSGGRLRDGYTKGKLFVGVFGIYDSNDAAGRCIKANPAEIGSIKLVSEDEILSKILPDNVRLRPKTVLKSQFVAHLLDQIEQY